MGNDSNLRIRANNHMAFEEFVLKLFNYYSINDIKRNIYYRGIERLEYEFTSLEVDFYLNETVLVETKMYSQKQINLNNLLRVLDGLKKNISEETYQNKKILLIVANVVDFENLNSFKEKYPELKFINILDIRNLFYLVKDNEMLTEELVSLLSFSVANEEYLLPNFNSNVLVEMFDEKNISREKLSLDINEQVSADNELLNKLKTWQPNGISNFSDFEKLCTDVLKKLLNDNLMLWRTQENSNEKMYRFDLICKIKSDSIEEFWNILINHFGTRYLIFEFKNYKNKITQQEIYTTEKYLYAKALRSVAIIVSPKGEDKNAKKAIKGTLRENGKLILSLTTSDLITMLEAQGKKGEETPSDYLARKLDELLIELEK